MESSLWDSPEADCGGVGRGVDSDQTSGALLSSGAPQEL